MRTNVSDLNSTDPTRDEERDFQIGSVGAHDDSAADAGIAGVELEAGEPGAVALAGPVLKDPHTGPVGN